MKPIGEFIKSTLIGGLLVILPLALVATVAIKGVGMLKPVVDPIVPLLPGRFNFPLVIASVLMVLLCSVAGLLARTPVVLHQKVRVIKYLALWVLLLSFPSGQYVDSFFRAGLKTSSPLEVSGFRTRKCGGLG